MKMSKRLPLLLFLLLIGLFTIEACKHDPLPVPNPNPQDTTKIPSDTNKIQCSPDTVYFKQTILPLLTSSCGMYGCHDAVSAAGGLNVLSYDSIMASGEVKPFKPFNSDLFERIIESDPDKMMPPSGFPRLSASQKEAINKWILQGAKNNSCEASSCDTSGIKYSSYIKNLLETNCTGCHSGSSPAKGIGLDTYTKAKAAAVNTSFLGSIEHKAGFTPMPSGLPKLKDCDILKIKSWINSGMPE
jgi:hypothetical protein